MAEGKKRKGDRERSRQRELGTPARGTAVFEKAPMNEGERKNAFVSTQYCRFTTRALVCTGQTKAPCG